MGNSELEQSLRAGEADLRPGEVSHIAQLTVGKTFILHLGDALEVVEVAKGPHFVREFPALGKVLSLRFHGSDAQVGEVPFPISLTGLSANENRRRSRQAKNWFQHRPSTSE